jgi:KipI family sensor histidine kinase inhibitor
VQSAGDDLISVTVPDPRAAQSLAAALRETQDWLEAVAGIESVVVQFDISLLDRRDAENRVRAVLAKLGPSTSLYTKIVEIPIVYGGEFGPDLDFVCEKLALTRDEFIELHSGRYEVDMLGFIPGFAYIGGLDERLNIDRLPEPRQYIPAGSVGISGGRTGLYALPGPGGWPIVGRTGVCLFDPAASNPFTLSAGTSVVFRAVDSL